MSLAAQSSFNQTLQYEGYHVSTNRGNADFSGVFNEKAKSVDSSSGNKNSVNIRSVFRP